MQKASRKLIVIGLIVFGLSNFIAAQTIGIAPADNTELNWFLTSGIGVQMSGIKDEDFVSHNIAPLVNIMAGKWFSHELALQVGYKGPYYNAIADDKKHHYYFIYAEALMNMNSFCKNYQPSNLWRLYLHAGAGYYYNYDYNRPDVCANLGLTNGFRISNCLQANLDVSAIVGWDIYQGDEDILPGISVGLTYFF
ncbi:MAG: hypothetical protein AB9834_16315 [Lentimicrobium sp.]